MNLVVDTSVWSLVLRRKIPDMENEYAEKVLFHLERNDQIFLAGPILTELLDGISKPEMFNKIIKYFEPFPCLEFTREDYIQAARLKTLCRNKDVHAGLVDFLICSACLSNNCPLLTADNDFTHIAKHIGLQLL